MNIKMTTNSQLSTESKNCSQLNLKNQTKQTTRTGTGSDTEILWRVISWEGGGGEWGKRYRE